MKFVRCALGAAVCVATVATARAETLPAIKADVASPVPECATPGRLMAYLQVRNPALEPRFGQIATHYMRTGEEFGLRWDFAFFQMIVDTASLTFRRGNGQPGLVRAGQNNFAGLGVSGGGNGSESFADVATGVRAHLQHVLLYSGAPVWAPIAERTRLVRDQRLLASWQGVARQPIGFTELARHWAPSDPSYGVAIASVAARFYGDFCSIADPAPQLTVAARKVPVVAAERKEPPGEGADLARRAVEVARADDGVPRMAAGAATVDPPPASVPAAAEKPMQIANLRILNPMPVAPVVEQPAVRPEPAPVVVAAAVPPPSPLAAPRISSADDLVKNFVSGRTVLLDTPLGTTIPIEFREDGTMQGQARSLAGLLGAATDQGRWWVNRAKLCQRWSVWFDKETQCLKLRQTGRTIHWVRDDGQTGTAKFAR